MLKTYVYVLFPLFEILYVDTFWSHNLHFWKLQIKNYNLDLSPYDQMNGQKTESLDNFSFCLLIYIFNWCCLYTPFPCFSVIIQQTF